MDALGDPKAAIRLYKEATTIDPNTNVWAYDGIGTAIEASFPGNLRDAVRAYRQALNLEDNDLTRFHLGVALERLGEESEEIMDSIRRSEANYACLVDSWGYIRYAK
jgi:tetratricopeptide (TPR) repeat protein